MRALNDLVIRGPRPEVAAFLQRLEGNLTGGWRRDREREARLQDMRVGSEGAFCFSCTDIPGRPAAALWLQARDPEEWFVSNIVPLGRHTLSDEEYNHVLGEFDSRYNVFPVRDLAGLGGCRTATLGDPQGYSQERNRNRGHFLSLHMRRNPKWYGLLWWRF